MVSPPVSPFAAAMLLAAFLPAQVFIVDASNGPGTNYTSIATATAAAPDGAVIRVRAGTYDNFRVVGKSLTVDAEAGVSVLGNLFQFPPIEVVDLGPTQFVSIRGFRFDIVFGSVAISCRDSAGPIFIEDCSTNSPSTIQRGRVRATNCEHVYLRACDLRGAGFFVSPLESYNSNVALHHCNLTSENFCFRIGGSRVHMTDCTLDSNPASAFPTGVGFMIESTLVLNLDTTLQSHASTVQPGLVGDGVAVFDPSVQLLGSTGPVEPGITVETRRVPPLTTGRTPATGNVFGNLGLQPGEMGVLFVGFPDQPEFFAGIPDPFWLESAAVQVTGSGAALTSSFPVPNLPWVLGVQIMWQGATYGLGTNLVRVSNPAPLVLF
ncbi:MAG: hypothetical protein NXI31_02190 [bacterium]|nr:hypothetical protein [bacterium]